MQTTSRKFTTVVMEYADREPVLRPFYCCRCGKCVCEVYGDAKLIVPGVPEPVDIAGLGVHAVFNCNGFYKDRSGRNVRCDAKYAF